MRYSVRWVGGLALCASAAAVAAPTPLEALTLEEALIATVESSPDLRVQRSALRGLDEQVASARAGKRPTVTGDVNIGGSFTSRAGRVPGTSHAQFPSSLGLNLTQSIYDGGQTRNAVDAAYANVRGGRFSLLSTQQSVLLQAVAAYVGVIQAQQNVAIAQKNVEVIAEQLEAAQARFDVGEVTRTDVAQAEAALAEARANLANQRGSLGQEREGFRRDVGILPNGLAPLPPLPTLPKTLEEAREIAQSSHPDILSAEASVESASFAVRQAIGATLPQLDVSANFTNDFDTINGPESSRSGAVTLNGSVPLYVGGSLRAAVRSAQASAAQARAQLNVTSRVILEQVGIAWETFKASQAAIRANVAQIEAEQVAFDGVREEAKVGARTTLEVLEAEEDLLEARLALVSSRASEYLNAYSLLSAIGLLTIEKLDLQTERYDPVAAYESSQGALRGYDSDEDTEWRYNFRP